MTITFAGSWLDSDLTAASDGVRDLSKMLSEITGLSPDEAFTRLFGDITFEAVKSCGTYHAQVDAWDKHKIKFAIRHVTSRLVIHELGHLCNDNVPEEESPAHLLSVYGVKTPSGRMVTGPGAGGYQRHMGMYPPKNGYLYFGYPWQQHSRRMWKGNTCIEDWPDMLLACVYREFADNEPGLALNSWVTNYLIKRLL